MDTVDIIRELAKLDESQNLYILSKEIGTIKIFENDRNFTYIQNLFLKYLSFYYTLYTDIALGDVSDIVLKNFIREDAYIMYKNKSEKERFRNKPLTERNKNDINTIHGTQWIFHKKSKQAEK